MTGAFRDTMPARIEAARRRLAEVRLQRAEVEARHERAHAALGELTSRAPSGRRSTAVRWFALGAFFSVVIPFLVFALGQAPR